MKNWFEKISDSDECADVYSKINFNIDDTSGIQHRKEIMTMSNYKFETLQLHVGQENPDPATDARAVPIYQTTSYVFHNSAHAAARFGLADSGNIYGRLTNSTQDVLEKRVAALEGGAAALALASGAAAITYTLEALGQNGGHFVAQKTIYGGWVPTLLAHTLPNFGITASFVNIHNLDEVEAAIKDNTRAIYIETLGNPNSDIPDMNALSNLLISTDYRLLWITPRHTLSHSPY